MDRKIVELLEAMIDSRLLHSLSGPADRLVQKWEKSMGIGEGARRAYYGNNEPERQSLLLNYTDSLIRKMREEMDGEAAAGQAPERGGRHKKRQPGRLTEMFRQGNITEIFERAPRFREEMSGKPPKIFENDILTPRERISRHINFEKADRVGVAPLWGYHVARAGGISVRDFMTDGRKAAAACRKAWDSYGGFDMLPIQFNMGYLFPFIPDSHTRFWNEWVLPKEDELPKMEEVALLSSLDDVIEEGIIPLARTEAGRLIGEFRRMALQAAIYSLHISALFPGRKPYREYAAGIVNHPADLLSFWMGFEKFMMACVEEPGRVREACAMLAPGFVETGEFTARLLGSRQLLYGVSRISGSFISRKMFDDLFADTFLDQVKQLHDDGFCITYHLDNDYTPMLDFFRDELPPHSGFMHLDQTDMCRAKEMLHGKLCLMGNLHPGLTATGSPADVEAECERLIKEVGAGGGFILSSACELPLDARRENVTAIKKAVDKWGWYD